MSEGVDKTASYDERIKQKDIPEVKLIARINKKQKVPLFKSEKTEDMAGVDAYYTFKGKQVTVALKEREKGSGDDPLIEAITPWIDIDKIEDIKFTGRDLKSSADKYYFVDTKGTLRISDGPYIRKAAKEMTYEFVEKYLKNKQCKCYRVKGGMVKIQLDHSNGALYNSGKVYKLLVFFDPKDMKLEHIVSLDD